MSRSLTRHPTHWRERQFLSILLPVKMAVVLALFFLPLAVQGQNLKIGVVNMQKALATIQEGQKASQDLAAKVNPKQKEFNTRQQEIADLETQLNRGTAMTDQKKAELASEIDSKKRRLDRDTQDADEELRNEQQALVQKLGQRIMTVITKYAKDNNYTLVLGAGDASNQVVFATPATDITDIIVSLYDKTYANQTSPPPGRP